MQLQVAFSFGLILLISIISAKDVKVFKRGKQMLIDETQFKNPNDYSFDDDQDETDLDNAYDEKVPYLPKFILHKSGIDRGYTRVPIVTRRGSNTWSTPRPTTQRGEEYKTWSTPKLLPITKPTPSHKDIITTTSTPKTTFIAKFSIPPLKAEKPPKKPEVKSTTSASIEETSIISKTKKTFTRKPTTSSSNERVAEESMATRKAFTRTSASASQEETSKSSEVFFTRKPITSTESDIEVFTTDFSRKGFTKRPKTTKSTTITSTSSEETSTSAATRKKFTRKPTTSTSASSETSTSRKKFTRKPTSTEASTEKSTEASSRKAFTRRPISTSVSAEETRRFQKTKQFTKRPSTSASTSTEKSTETVPVRKAFSRRPKTTTTATTTEAPTTETTTTMLPLRERLRPTLTTREPTPTMQRRFRVFTNPPPALPPTEEISEKQIPSGKQIQEKIRFGTISDFATQIKRRKAKISSAIAATIAKASHWSSAFLENSIKSTSIEEDEPLDFGSTESKLVNFHFSKFAQRFGIRRIIPSASATPQASIVVIPVTVSPSKVASNSNSGHGMEQTVKSNAIILQSQKNRFFLPSNVSPNPSIFSPSTPESTTSSPRVVHRWKSSWSSWTSWDANGHKITGSTKTFTDFDSPEATTPTASSKQRQFSRTRNEQHSTTSTKSHSSTASKAPLKPPIIHHGSQRYRGPTYNCRILTPNEDGRPSNNNDSSCKLKYPGFPADDTCRCTYEVEARDEHGCATGFLYTCKQIARRT